MLVLKTVIQRNNFRELHNSVPCSSTHTAAASSTTPSDFPADVPAPGIRRKLASQTKSWSRSSSTEQDKWSNVLKHSNFPIQGLTQLSMATASGCL